jgi:hypothetical protein
LNDIGCQLWAPYGWGCVIAGAARGRIQSPAVGVVTGGPIHIDEVLRRNEFAVGAVDDEEEAVLRRMTLRGAPSMVMSARTSAG